MRAKLTEAEDVLWTKVFSDAVNHGKAPSRADREAWAAVKKAFPRLRKYAGCKP